MFRAELITLGILRAEIDAEWPLKWPYRTANLQTLHFKYYSTNIRTEYFKHAA
jgi:alpha-mannosidase